MASLPPDHRKCAARQETIIESAPYVAAVTAAAAMALFALVVGGGNLGQQYDVRERFFRVVPDQRVSCLGNDGFVQIYRFLKFRMHEP